MRPDRLGYRDGKVELPVSLWSEGVPLAISPLLTIDKSPAETVARVLCPGKERSREDAGRRQQRPGAVYRQLSADLSIDVAARPRADRRGGDLPGVDDR